MIDRVWTVICSRAVIDRDSNNVSLQNAIEQIKVPDSLPLDEDVAVPLEWSIVTLWTRSDFDKEAYGYDRWVLVAPDGQELAHAEREINMRGDYRRCRTISRLVGFRVHGLGRYHVVIGLRCHEDEDWREVGRIPVDVAQ